jgi:hypothetical protein
MVGVDVDTKGIIVGREDKVVVLTFMEPFVGLSEDNMLNGSLGMWLWRGILLDAPVGFKDIGDAVEFDGIGAGGSDKSVPDPMGCRVGVNEGANGILMGLEDEVLIILVLDLFVALLEGTYWEHSESCFEEVVV